jgi:hypothetical protein
MKLPLPLLLASMATAACGGDDGPSADAGPCLLIENTTDTTTAAPSGCHVLDRDTTACDAQRMADGLDGFWLDFSCRVTLTAATGAVQAQADGQPDHLSNYFDSADACWESYDQGENPNEIAAKAYTIQFPTAPDTTETTQMMIAVVGLAVNGVPIFANFAAPGDDIFEEALTFDRCGGHPQMQGAYHYHSEPYSISYDDDRLIGVMRDGYPIYGRRDSDGSLPTLDQYGGHTSVTPHSPTTAVYHYHVNEQTSTNPGTLGEKQWFLTTGTFRGMPGSCTGGC